MFNTKKILRMGALMAALCASNLSGASTAEASMPKVERIALVDLQQVLTQTKQGKAARSQLEKSFKAKQKKLDSQRKQLESEQKKLQSLSGSAQEQAFAKLQQKAQELQAMYMTLQQELAGQEARLVEKIYVNCQKLVAGMASELKVDLVLVRSQETVLFADKGMDVTAQIIKRYNKKHRK